MMESKKSPSEWEHREHAVVREFQQRVAEMVEDLDRRGRGQDLDRVADYSQKPRGDVSRLTAVFWTIDEDYQKPVRELVDEFRRQADEEFGQTPDDALVYELMYEVYLSKRG
jgi:hypothetical protein